MDVLLLSRLQFALTIMFHYLFPPLTIGMSVVLVYLKGRHLVTKDPLFDQAARFWTRIFGLNFALGVVTGIVMEFEFGTNWAAYSRYVGDVFGSALAAEGIFAFFLESGFLALLLFGWDRVSPAMHFFSTVMVAIGSVFSSVWIVVANSWQQTPAGHHIVTRSINGIAFQRAEIVDFWAMVFNPSTMHRLVHVWIGALILGACFVMSIAAWYLLKGRHVEFAKRSFVGGLMLAAFACVAQFASGHLQAINVATHQPAKLAAMEALYTTEANTPLLILGWPDDAAGRVHAAVGIPGLLSFMVHGNTATPVAGFDELEPVWGKPPVLITFLSYRIMIGIGVLLTLLSGLGVLYLARGRLYQTRWLLWLFVASVIPAVIANETGWVTAEVGRQPWIVYPTLVDGQPVGGLRTSDGLSEAVRGEAVLGSIIMFSLIYILLFVLWLFLLNNKIQHGPDATGSRPDEGPGSSGSGLVDAATGLVGHKGSLAG